MATVELHVATHADGSSSVKLSIVVFWVLLVWREMRLDSVAGTRVFEMGLNKLAAAESARAASFDEWQITSWRAGLTSRGGEGKDGQ